MKQFAWTDYGRISRSVIESLVTPITHRPLSATADRSLQFGRHRTLAGLAVKRSARLQRDIACAMTVAPQDDMRHEAQHRMANSVQIVASILKQSAQSAATQEAQHELQAAHHRIMAIIVLHRQFTASGPAAVPLAAYLQQVTASLGTSLLAPDGNVGIETRCEPRSVDQSTATSLGLVVTELVINAIKHAFPHGRKGTIAVDFRQSGGGWTLSVADDGIGTTASAGNGLGARIVPALAAQLQATVTQQDARPGSRTTLRHG